MRTLFISIALAGLTCTAPAFAQPAGDSFAVSISYADLNLSSTAGLATFRGRVKAGADRACVGVGDSPLQQLLQVQKCRANFISSADQQLHMAMDAGGGSRFAAR